MGTPHGVGLGPPAPSSAAATEGTAGLFTHGGVWVTLSACRQGGRRFLATSAGTAGLGGAGRLGRALLGQEGLTGLRCHGAEEGKNLLLRRGRGRGLALVPGSCRLAVGGPVKFQFIILSVEDELVPRRCCGGERAAAVAVGQTGHLRDAQVESRLAKQ